MPSRRKRKQQRQRERQATADEASVASSSEKSVGRTGGTAASVTIASASDIAMVNRCLQHPGWQIPLSAYRDLPEQMRLIADSHPKARTRIMATKTLLAMAGQNTAHARTAIQVQQAVTIDTARSGDAPSIKRQEELDEFHPLEPIAYLESPTEAELRSTVQELVDCGLLGNKPTKI